MSFHFPFSFSFYFSERASSGQAAYRRLMSSHKGLRGRGRGRGRPSEEEPVPGPSTGRGPVRGRARGRGRRPPLVPGAGQQTLDAFIRATPKPDTESEFEESDSEPDVPILKAEPALEPADEPAPEPADDHRPAPDPVPSPLKRRPKPVRIATKKHRSRRREVILFHHYFLLFLFSLLLPKL